jgi:hypothetical protein
MTPQYNTLSMWVFKLPEAFREDANLVYGVARAHRMLPNHTVYHPRVCFGDFGGRSMGMDPFKRGFIYSTQRSHGIMYSYLNPSMDRSVRSRILPPNFSQHQQDHEEDISVFYHAPQSFFHAVERSMHPTKSKSKHRTEVVPNEKESEPCIWHLLPIHVAKCRLASAGEEKQKTNNARARSPIRFNLLSPSDYYLCHAV